MNLALVSFDKGEQARLDFVERLKSLVAVIQDMVSRRSRERVANDGSSGVAPDAKKGFPDDGRELARVREELTVPAIIHLALKRLHRQDQFFFGRDGPLLVEFVLNAFFESAQQ